MGRRLLFVALLLTTVAAYANPINAAFLGWNGGQWQNGYPYYVSFGPSGLVTAVMCDDYPHGGSPGQTWLADITNLGSGNLSLARYNLLPNALTLYDEAGWILLQTPFTPTTQWAPMSYAVWHIFDAAVPLDPQSQFWLDQAIAEAGLGFPGVNFNEVSILTPVNQYDPDPNSMQEFLYINDPSGGGSTPEPGTLLLLATGLLPWLKRRLLG